MQGDFFWNRKLDWAGLGAIGNTEPIMSNFCGWFFQVFRCKKIIQNFIKNIVASPHKVAENEGEKKIVIKLK